MSELGKKVNKAIERFKIFEPEEGYWLAFSGGKDSVVIKALAQMAGVKFDAHYSLTSVDPPELVQFIKEKHSDVEIDIPRYADGRQITMWNLISKKLMPPTRKVRYCCSVLKERGGEGRVTVTGVRWAESLRRANNAALVSIWTPQKRSSKYAEEFDGAVNKNGGLMLNNDNDETRKIVDMCYRQRKTTVNPIIDWTDDELWQFITDECVDCCGLYDEGFERLGCVGCPMAGKHGREKEFFRWPTYKKAYIKAFDKMLVEREARGRAHSWQNGADVFNWWMEYDVLSGQMDLFEDYEM